MKNRASCDWPHPIGWSETWPVTVVIRYCKVLCLVLTYPFLYKTNNKKKNNKKNFTNEIIIIIIIFKCEPIERKNLKCTATPPIGFKSVPGYICMNVPFRYPSGSGNVTFWFLEHFQITHFKVYFRLASKVFFYETRMFCYVYILFKILS